MTMLDEELAAFAQLTVALRQPFYQWWVAVFQAMLALLAGRFGEAEHLAHRAAVLGQRVQDHTSVQSVLFTQLWIIRQEQGRVQELQALQPAARILPPAIPSPGKSSRPFWPVSWGRRRRPGVSLRSWRPTTSLGWGMDWLGWLIMMLSQVCVFLGDVRAATLYTLLHPMPGGTW